MAGAEHHGAGERDRRQREHDGKEGKPDQLKPHGGQVANSQRREEACRKRRQGDDDGEQDHGENR